MSAYLPSTDVSGYFAQFKDFAESKALGSFTPLKEGIPFGNEDFPRAMSDFYKHAAKQVWSALPPDIKLNVIEELGNMAVKFLESVVQDVTEAVMNVVTAIADLIPFIGAIIKFAIAVVKQIVQAGKNHADYLDRDRTRVRWAFEKELYTRAPSLGIVFADTVPWYTPRSITGTKMKSHPLYTKVGSFWLPSRTATQNEWTPMLYPWATPRWPDLSQPLPIAAACTTNGQDPMQEGQFNEILTAPKQIQDTALCVNAFNGGIRAKPPAALGLDHWPFMFDRNSEPATIQTLLLSDPAANLAVPTSHLKAISERLATLGPKVYKGSRGGEVVVTEDHIETARLGLTAFIKAREGFMRDPNACLRALDAAKSKPANPYAKRSTVDPTILRHVQETAKATTLVTVNLNGLGDVFKKNDSSSAPLLAFGAAALIAGGVYLRSRRK